MNNEIAQIIKDKELLQEEIRSFLDKKREEFKARHDIDVSISVNTITYRNKERIYNTNIEVEASICL